MATEVVVVVVVFCPELFYELRVGGVWAVQCMQCLAACLNSVAPTGARGDAKDGTRSQLLHLHPRSIRSWPRDVGAHSEKMT
ncbi:hypothetical protein O3P69_016920 [Scylla paramamosain]|uniref:Secreted protein n=1 Tax=Scylla paramamosain TaxID=85552 RepID=A0AAW0TSW3_SCYPA